MKIKRRQLEVPPPFVSMADIAFNLVLFFIILARTQDDSHIQWEPAKVVGTSQIANSRVTVAVDKENRVYLNGKQVSVNDLASGIEPLLANAPTGDRVVQLKVHKDTLAATFEPILEAVSQAGGDVVHVLEEKKR